MWRGIDFLRNETKEDLIWFFVLVGWIPIIAAYSIFPSFDSTENGLNILIPESKSLFNNYLVITSLLFILLLGLSTNLHKYKINKPFIVAGLPLLSAALIPLFNESTLLTPFQSIAYGIFLFSIIVSVYIYLKYAHIISRPFIIFCLLLLADSLWLSITDLFSFYDIEASKNISGIIDGHYSLFGTIFDLYTVDFFKLLLFVFFFILVRICYLAYIENIAFARELLKKHELGLYSKSTFKLWYPMILIFIGCAVFYWALNNYWFSPTLIHYFNEDNAALIEMDPDDYPDTVEQALLSRNETNLKQANKNLQKRIKQLKNDLKTNTGEAPEKIRDGIEEVLPGRLPGTKIKKCGIDIIVCPVANGIKSLTNRAYVSTKYRELEKLEKELEIIANDTSLTVDQKAKKMQEKIDSSIERMQSVSKTAVNSSFKAYSYFSILMFVYTVIILIKTFLIVFSRISFSPGTSNHATFNTDATEIPQGKIKRLKDKFKLAKSDKKNYYFARQGITIAGVPPARKTPQMFTAIFTRILHKRWSFNYVQPSRSTAGVTISVAKPSEFVNWKLSEGEKVYFHFSDFIGMSEDVTIKRHISLSVSTLLFGRIIYYYAEGPGYLYLKTKAQPAISPGAEASSGQNSALLVAWNKQVGFKIDASQTKVDTFLSDYHVKPVKEDDLLVLDLSEDRGTSTSAGILRFIKSFLLPV